MDGAIAAYQEAIRLPNRKTRSGMSISSCLLFDKKDFDGAIAAHQAEAIRPRSRKIPRPNAVSATPCARRSDLAGAIAAYKTAIRLDPKYVLAHNNLGNALREKKDFDGRHLRDINRPSGSTRKTPFGMSTSETLC